MAEPAEWLSLLGRRLPPTLGLRTVSVAPGRTRPYREADWRDALVVVEQGEIELECLNGCRRAFRRGDVLWLAGLPLRALNNRGRDTALLAAVSRQGPMSSRRFPSLNGWLPSSATPNRRLRK